MSKNQWNRIPLGTQNEIFKYVDFLETPHIMIKGFTGSGKTSLLFNLMAYCLDQGSWSVYYSAPYGGKKISERYCFYGRDYQAQLDDALNMVLAREARRDLDSSSVFTPQLWVFDECADGFAGGSTLDSMMVEDLIVRGPAVGMFVIATSQQGRILDLDPKPDHVQCLRIEYGYKFFGGSARGRFNIVGDATHVDALECGPETTFRFLSL